jgi:hypothetical protein
MNRARRKKTTFQSELFRRRGRGRNRPRPKGSNSFAIGLLGVAGLIALGLLIIGHIEPGSVDTAATAETADKADAAGICLHKILPALDVVLIDATERLEADRVERLTFEIHRRARALPTGGKLVVGVIFPFDDGDNAKALFSACKPPDGSRANDWTQNRRMMEEDYRKGFVEPLEKALALLPTFAGGMSSPIFGALYTVSTIFEWEAEKKTLLIASDLLEYTSSTLSMYRAYSWDKALGVAKVRAVQGRLVGVEVSVMLRIHARASTLQTSRHARFWKRYFHHAGTDAVHFTAL